MRRISRRLAPLAVALIALAIPATSLASQTLTVEKVGTGTGTVTSSPAGISCDPTCSFAFADNTAVLLTGTPGANTEAVQWSGCESVNIEHKCKVTMSAARTVRATFDLTKRKLTVSKSGTGTGTVTSSPAGINCGTECSAEYDNGTEVTLSGTPGANTEAVKWTGCTSVDGENHCKVTMTAAKTVGATFNLHKVELKVSKGGLGTGTVTSSPSGINCGSTCSFLFGEGQTITLAGTPSGETEAVKWTGCDSVNAEGKCVVAMNGLREVGAVFNVKGPTLTVARLGNGTGTVTSTPAAIECGVACAVNFLKGTTVTLSGTPGLHSEAARWSGCDSEPEGKCVVAMSSAREVIASFSLEPQWVEYTISIGIKGTGAGLVTSIPGGIECPADCSGTYLFKTQLSLHAIPAAGSEFDHWSIGSCATSALCSTTVKSSRLISAVFVAVGNRTLTVSKQGSGQGTVTSKPAAIDCGSTCSAQVEASAKVTLKAKAAAGSKFTGWSGEGCLGTANCRVTMNEARNVTATFTKQSSPAAPRCVVPRLAGKTLARARAALANADCALGRIRKPKGAKLAKLRVRSASAAAGTTLPAGAKVNLRLGRPRKH